MITLRAAEIRDLAKIVSLWSEMMELHQGFNSIFATRPNAGELYAEYAKSLIPDPTKLTVVAENNGVVIGYAHCEIVEYPPVYHESRAGAITELSVNKSYWRRGVGKSLVNECIKWVREQGITRIDVTVASDNPISQGFWKGVGLTPYNCVCWCEV